MKTLLNITLLVCLSLVGLKTKAQDSTTVSTLPDIELRNIEGEAIKLSKIHKEGKNTVISFWATWCKPCIKELKKLSEYQEEWEEKYNVQIIAISVDDPRTVNNVKPFVYGMNWDFEVLLDPNGNLQRKMNVQNPPVSFLIDSKGQIVYSHVGYVPGDEIELKHEIEKLVEKKKEANTKDEETKNLQKLNSDSVQGQDNNQKKQSYNKSNLENIKTENQAAKLTKPNQTNMKLEED